MVNNFAIRLDQVFSVFNSKDTVLYEDATKALGELVKEAYETHIRVKACKNGKWETIKELPVVNCTIKYEENGEFALIYENDYENEVEVFNPNSEVVVEDRVETLNSQEVQLHNLSDFRNIYVVVDSTDNLVYADTSQFAAQAKCRDFNNSEKYYHWQPFRVVRLEE